jgi:2-polyprenyl-6-methoxyphenol hydroxylase-like FAD-dependent oxidoreductase
MRVSRRTTDPNQALGRFRAGKILVTLNRGEYWQCAYVIQKGGLDALREAGLPAFRQDIADIAPFMASRMDEITDWKAVKLLTVKVDRLRRWSRPGLVCIGDCAHAMSPVGGVGINLAIQDAVAAANLLALPLLGGAVRDKDLERIQRRRSLPTRLTQGVQVYIHRNFIHPALGNRKPIHRLPFRLRLLQQFPRLRRLPARIVGLGFRPEHVATPNSRSDGAQ